MTPPKKKAEPKKVPAYKTTFQPDTSLPPLLQAVSIVRAVLKLTKKRTWADFAAGWGSEDAGVVERAAYQSLHVTSDQCDLLERYAVPVSFVVHGENAAASTTVCRCNLCGRWAVGAMDMFNPKVKNCFFSLGCPGDLQRAGAAKVEKIAL